MDQDHQEHDAAEERATVTDGEQSEKVRPEQQPTMWASTAVTEDVNGNGSWSQKSFSRSLQRAEVLLRSTFTPGLKWLFHSRSQDEEEEKHIVVAHNLVSRSSARLLQLQQVLQTVAPQWQLVEGTPWASQACVKAPPGEGGVSVLALSPYVQECYRTLCRLLQQRSLLLFVHEYSRRVQLAAAFISRLQHLQELQLKTLLTDPLPSTSVTLCSLTQELRVHLHHWPCLASKVQSDPHLRAALVQLTGQLGDIQQTLGSLALQALLLIEHHVHAALCALAQADLELVPREVLEDTLAGMELYNQAVEELRMQRGLLQQRTGISQQAHHCTFNPHLPKTKKSSLSPFSVKELVGILAQHHAKLVSKQLHGWISQPSGWSRCDSTKQVVSWTWEQLLRTYRIPSDHGSEDHQTLESTSHVPQPHSPNPDFINPLRSHPISPPPFCVQRKDFRCLTSHTDPVPTALHSVCPPAVKPPALSVSSTSCIPPANLHLSQGGPTDPCSVQLLFQVLVASSGLLVPLVSHRSVLRVLTEAPPTAVTDVLKRKGNESIQSHSVDHQRDPHHGCEVGPETVLGEAGTQQEHAEQGSPEHAISSQVTAGQLGFGRWHHSVQWVDLGQPLVFSDVLGLYRDQLWSWCSTALWLQLHFPQAAEAAASLHLQGNHAALHALHRIHGASEAALLTIDSHRMLQDFSLCLFISTAHAHWDYDLCRSLGSALKDKCPVTQGHKFEVPSSSSSSSVTMEHFLLLLPPLLSSLHYQHSHRRVSAAVCGLLPSTFSQRSLSVAFVLASLQLSTVWVMSKAQQFLSSWSLNKFLLITQGDLKMLKGSMKALVHQTKSLVESLDSNHHSIIQSHNQVLLSHLLEALSRVVTELQTFSSLVLRTFSQDCKRMSGEIFKRTMPSAVHWRPGHRTAVPRSPSEYASVAAQSVIGQVLEGVAPLPDDARVQALSITMTAFMEAWMEHILKQKIKFSVQGALQLKEDFDCIREMIQADRYGLSAELHQRLLSLRVFQQVDSAVTCLLQQPQAKPYLQSRTWESLSQCCPAISSTDSLDAAVSSSITNLRSAEDELPTDPSAVTTDLPPLDTSNSAEPYLTPSVNTAQQQWLDLRIQNSGRRWRLPGLQCLSKSEP